MLDRYTIKAHCVQMFFVIKILLPFHKETNQNFAVNKSS